MKTRRDVLMVGNAGVCALAAPLLSFAQKKPAKAYRIGVLNGGSPASAGTRKQNLLHERDGYSFTPLKHAESRTWSGHSLRS